MPIGREPDEPLGLCLPIHSPKLCTSQNAASLSQSLHWLRRTNPVLLGKNTWLTSKVFSLEPFHALHILIYTKMKATMKVLLQHENVTLVSSSINFFLSKWLKEVYLCDMKRISFAFSQQISTFLLIVESLNTIFLSFPISTFFSVRCFSSSYFIWICPHLFPCRSPASVVEKGNSRKL